MECMIQIFGQKKCRVTQKALRFFKERGVDIQFRDIALKPPSDGELDAIARAVGGEAALIDITGAAATKKGLSYMVFDVRDELRRDPQLLRSPIVRRGKDRAVIGLDEAGWKALLES